LMYWVRPVPSKQALNYSSNSLGMRGEEERKTRQSVNLVSLSLDNLIADVGCNPQPCVNQEMLHPYGSD
jgi:hypothetical protein